MHRREANDWSTVLVIFVFGNEGVHGVTGPQLARLNRIVISRGEVILRRPVLELVEVPLVTRVDFLKQIRPETQ